MSDVYWLRPMDENFPSEFMIVEGNSGGVTVFHKNSYQSRARSTVKIVLEAMSLIDDERLYFRIPICTGDRPSDSLRVYGRHVLAYSTYDHTPWIIPIPDFGFDCWIEAGIPKYDEIVAQMSERGRQTWTFPKVFWIGNPMTNPARTEAISKTAGDERFEIIPMSWSANPSGLTYSATRYVSLEDHVSFQCLVDLPANGYSGRQKLLLWSNRAVILIANPFKQFYDPYLKDGINCMIANNIDHFIAIGKELIENPQRCTELGASATEMARQHLTKDAAINYLADVLMRYCRS